ncbi:BET1-like protein [Lineus longissimus]|uniref:BET1-like protein n=1 Tax=Lineus longissimus TaxID=88925 RepID=UPI002B4D06C4
MARYNRSNRMEQSAGATHEIMERENQDIASNLSSKVNRLKNIAFDIETEAKDQNKYLSGMDSDFDSSEGLLSGSMKRMNGMLSSGKGNRRLMCYIILGLVVTFIVIYYFVSWFRAG